MSKSSSTAAAPMREEPTSSADDVLTICAISILAAILSNILHEGVGHGLIALLTGYTSRVHIDFSTSDRLPSRSTTIVAPEESGRIAASWRPPRNQALGRSSQTSCRVLRPDGAVIWLEKSGRAFFDTQGKMLTRALRVLGPKLSHGQDRSAGSFSIYREIVA
jgi:hypothetical protein